MYQYGGFRLRGNISSDKLPQTVLGNNAFIATQWLITQTTFQVHH